MNETYDQIEMHRRNLETLKVYNIGTNQRISLGMIFLKKNILSISEFLESHKEKDLSFSNEDGIFSKSEIKYLSEHSIDLSLHYNAYLILIYTFWDTHLIRICRTLANSLRFQLRFQGNNNMDKAYQFLKGQLQLDLTLVDKEWNKLNNLKHLRDLIIHYDSNPKRKSQKTDKVVLSNRSINYSESTGYFYINNKELLIEYCKSIESFFKKITAQSEKLLEQKIETLNKELQKEQQFDLEKLTSIFRTPTNLKG